MIKLVHPTALSSHVCRHQRGYQTTCPSPTTGISSIGCLSVGRPSTRTLTWQLQHLLPSAAPSAGRPRCPRLPSTARSLVPGRFSFSRRFAAAIDCSLFPRSRVEVSGYVSTCCLMKMAAASSLDHICMKSAHRFLQPSVTVAINFFWF